MNSDRVVKFCDYPRLFLDSRKEYLRIFDEVASRGAFILQKELRELEENLSKFIGCKYTIGVANCTDALEIAWQSIKLRPGDEVICSSHTFIATASSIVMSGGVPVPVDIGDDNLINPEAIIDAINSRTVGIMPTHLNGRTCKMDQIMNIAKKYNLFVVEDSAQSLGSKYKNKHAGTFGDFGAISFYPAKVLGCFGDGGLIYTDNNNYFDKAYQLHDQGRNINGELKSWGRNSRLDNIQAALLNYKLTKYLNVIKRRREIASIYNEQFSDIEELFLPPPPIANGDHFDVYQNYEFQTSKRNQLKDYLENNGIGTLIQWGGKGIHQWESLGFTMKLPKVEKFFENCLMIPIWDYLTDDEVYYVTEKVRSFFRS